MRAPDFAYEQPEDLQRALASLARGDSVVALAGGQSLIPLLRFRLAHPDRVVDIGRLPGLGEVEVDAESIRLGALVTAGDVAASAAIADASPLWSEAAAVIADPLVRNMGTVGGNLAHADTANDLPAALVASRATVEVQGPEGTRSIEADDLFVAPFTTSLRGGELITEIVVPASPTGAYEKLKRAAVDYGIVAVAVHLDVDRDVSIVGAGIALSGASSVAQRMTRAEGALLGTDGDEVGIEVASNLVGDDAEVIDDERGTARYKRAVLRALSARALRRALSRMPR